jgi:ubiquinone/menaquinone biosynthesis C-methylase UbiE
VQSVLGQFSAAIAERIPLSDSAVLDVGCGDGSFARELARAGARMTGLECSEGQLAICRRARKVADESYVTGVAQALPFNNGAFDATVLRASLHHVPVDAMQDALREARRVMRPAGELFIFEPLTSGSNFELMRLVDDETAARAAAQATISLAIEEGWLSRRLTTTLVATVVYESVEELQRRILAIDASRGEQLAKIETDLRQAFERSGATCNGGRRFSQPFRLDVLGVNAGTSDNGARAPRPGTGWHRGLMRPRPGHAGD